MLASCSDSDWPSSEIMAMPSRCCPLRPATRTMKNSSRLLAEIDRKRSRSSTGWRGLLASSSTRLLKCSHDSSRLMKRPGRWRMRAVAPSLPGAAVSAEIAGVFWSMTVKICGISGGNIVLHRKYDDFAKTAENEDSVLNILLAPVEDPRHRRRGKAA